MNNPQSETIYMPLMDEGVDVWRPVLAKRLDDNRFLVVAQPYDRQAERWAYEPGTVVMCVQKGLDGQQALAAAAEG